MNVRILPVCVLVLIPLSLAADEITLIPTTGFATGANVNALAGPLFGSDIDSVDIGGPGMGTATASLLGNTATHDFATELDFSGSGGAFFDSSFLGGFSRTSTLDHRASAESIYFFSVDAPVEYEVMGFFSVDDEASTTVAGNVELEVELLEFESFDMSPPPPSTVS